MKKRLLKKQIITILIAVVVMIATTIITKIILKNGISNAFTIKTYKEAFAMTEVDRLMIKMFASGIVIMSAYGCYIKLQDNVEEEKDLILMERGELTWENL